LTDQQIIDHIKNQFDKKYKGRYKLNKTDINTLYQGVDAENGKNYKNDGKKLKEKLSNIYDIIEEKYNRIVGPKELFKYYMLNIISNQIDKKGPDIIKDKALNI
jgi:hypothetical protein